ncbi:MAG: hypothetical protein LBQ48_03045 [Oscillospiraceae bacterium]|nr:hypothetical protein [Oscillospiraceae bacterium]
MIKAQIAGVNLHMQPGNETFFERRLREYFKESEVPDITVTGEVCDVIPFPQGRETLRLRRSVVTAGEDGLIHRTVIDEETGAPLMDIGFGAQYAFSHIKVLRSRQSPLTPTDYEYMYSGEMFNNRLAVLGGFVLHSSSIVYKGRGVAFSANSGTGKSTHTGLWKDMLGDEVRYINDDKPAVRIVGGIHTLFGTPWSGKTDINSNIWVPLHAVVFIERGEENKIRRLGVTDSMYQLVTQVSRPYYDRDIGIRVLDAAQRLVTELPIYLLTCNISQNAVETVLNELF